MATTVNRRQLRGKRAAAIEADELISENFNLEEDKVDDVVEEEEELDLGYQKIGILEVSFLTSIFNIVV